MTDEQLDQFLALPKEEQKKILGRLTKPPQVLSILYRTLKEGVTYEEFEKAWLPPPLPHYDGTVHVINGAKIDNPNDIISIGIIHESWEDVLEETERTAQSDEKRGEAISKLADHKGIEIYHIKKAIDLGT